jgi:hypothetical protein
VTSGTSGVSEPPDPSALQNRLRHALAAVLVAAGLFALDRAVAPGDSERSEAGLHRKQSQRLVEKPKAKVVVIGQSTMGQWLTPQALGRVLDVAPAQILDAHLSGCGPDCNWSVIRNLRAQGRHFEEAYWGLNLFKMCAGPPHRTLMQQIEVTPLSDTPGLFLNHYANAASPAEYLGLWAGMTLSEAYRDPNYLLRRSAKWAFGSEAQPERWQALPTAKAPKRKPEKKAKFKERTCDITPEKTALQVGFIEESVDDLAALADRTFLLVLPDHTLKRAGSDAAYKQRWNDFRALMRELVKDHPTIHLVDLVNGGASTDRLYRDSVHLNAAGIAHQTRQLKRHLERLR